MKLRVHKNYVTSEQKMLSHVNKNEVAREQKMMLQVNKKLCYT